MTMMQPFPQSTRLETLRDELAKAADETMAVAIRPHTAIARYGRTFRVVDAFVVRQCGGFAFQRQFNRPARVDVPVMIQIEVK